MEKTYFAFFAVTLIFFITTLGFFVYCPGIIGAVCLAIQGVCLVSQYFSYKKWRRWSKIPSIYREREGK